LPNYLLITDNHLITDVNHPKVRLFSDKNILAFKTQLSNTNLDPVFNCDNVNDGYHSFECKLKECYDSSFKLVKLSCKRAKDKIWMTSGLKCSSHHKNRLYRKWRMTRSTKDAENYLKNYRRYYKQVILASEKSYFKEHFDTKINSVKQLWNNLASVASLGRKKNKVFKLKEDGKYLTDPSVLSINSIIIFAQRQIKIVITCHLRVFFPSLQGTVCFVQL